MNPTPPVVPPAMMETIPLPTLHHRTQPLRQVWELLVILSAICQKWWSPRCLVLCPGCQPPPRKRRFKHLLLLLLKLLRTTHNRQPLHRVPPPLPLLPRLPQLPRLPPPKASLAAWSAQLATALGRSLSRAAQLQLPRRRVPVTSRMLVQRVLLLQQRVTSLAKIRAGTKKFCC
jgi:hypothetical protein